MATSPADVPGKYDLVLSDGTDTEGYVLYQPWAGGESAKAPEKAIHSYSPVFVPRTNVEGNYGDDNEDFFMTSSQNDWSLGEQRRHTPNEGREPNRRYWQGSNIDVTVPGRVTLRPEVDAVIFTDFIESMTYDSTNDGVAVGAATNLFTVTSAGVVTDEGAHGLGNSPARWGMTSDGTNVYLTTEASGTAGVRAWDGTNFATFSATGSSTIAFLNNALYGLDSSGLLRRYSTAGASTTIHTWQDAEGTALTFGTTGRLQPFGGKLLILLPDGPAVPELWIYDGVGVSLLHQFPANFVPHDIEVLQGTVFVSGHLKQLSTFRPLVYYYSNGNIGKLWQANEYGSVGQKSPAMTAFGENLVFTDAQNSKMLVWNPETGGVSSIGKYTPNSSLDEMLAAADDFLLLSHGGETGSDFQTPVLVQTNGRRLTLPSPITVSWPSPTTDGSTLLLLVHIEDDGSDTPVVTTPSGWTLVGSVINSTDDTVRTYLFKIIGSAPRSGAQSVAYTTGSATTELQLLEFSGTGIQDVALATNSGFSTAPSTGTSATTTQNDELWFAAIGWSNPTPNLSAQSDDFILARSNTVLESFYKVVEATGEASMSATLSSGDVWNGLVATFKAKAEGDGSAFLFPSTSKATGGDVTNSLVDFDSSLNKLFRGIKVDFDAADDGDGGTIDISYRTNDVDGDFTSLQEDATSGQEYELGTPAEPITGQSISTKVTLSKGTSTDGPVLKRVYTRAAPKVEQRHRALYHIDATHSATDHTDAPIPKTPEAVVEELRSFAGDGSLLTVTDQLHSFTGVVERLDIAQLEGNDDPSYVVSLQVREV